MSKNNVESPEKIFRQESVKAEHQHQDIAPDSDKERSRLWLSERQRLKGHHIKEDRAFQRGAPLLLHLWLSVSQCD